MCLSYEKALAEAKALFGETLGDDPGVVCDRCFQHMNAIMPMRKWIEENRR